jgi:hypothetical protein
MECAICGVSEKERNVFEVISPKEIIVISVLGKKGFQD